MINATFNKRAKNPDNSDTYSMTIQAKRAQLHFDDKAKMVHVHLDQAEIQNYGKGLADDVAIINKNILEMPIPQDSQFSMEKSIQEYPNNEMEVEIAKARSKLATDRKHQVIAAGFQFAAGRPGEVKWDEVNRAFVEHTYWQSRVNQFETEKQQRTSMAFGSLLFVILGAPVGILFAKRDFLSAFMSCFVPIITLYYPLILFGINLGKEGTMEPTKALWIGNVLLAVLSVWVYPKIIRH